jgi:RNA recognition motif-containing protein
LKPQEERSDLRKYINDMNRNRVVKIRGLEWRVNEAAIAEFFTKTGGFSVTPNDVIIETNGMRSTGYALIFLKDPEEVRLAQQRLNKGYIGKRYIEFCNI